MDDRIQQLSKLDPNGDEFKKLRAEIISDHLSRIPEQYQYSCILLQKELDVLRSKMTAIGFMQALAYRMTQNIDELEDQLHALQALVEKNLPEKPRLKMIMDRAKDNSSQRS